MKKLILTVLVSALMIGECFAMHPYSKLAVDLKKKGYPQNLTVGNNLYLIKSDGYMEFRGEFPEEEFVIVPKLDNLVSNLADVNYELKHTVDTAGKEVWTAKMGFIQFAHENIWFVLAQVWMYEKGKR